HDLRSRPQTTGYRVVRAHTRGGTPTGEYEDVMTAFVADDDRVWGRPAGIAGAHHGARLPPARAATATPALPRPGILVYRAHEKRDAEGRSTDGKTRESVGRPLQQPADWTRPLSEEREAPSS